MEIRALSKTPFPFLSKPIFNQTLPFAIPRLKHFSTNPRKAPIQIIDESHERNLVSLASLFQRYGFSPFEIHTFLKKNRFLLEHNPSAIEKSLKILLSLKPSQEFLASIVYKCPAIIEFEYLKKWDMGFSKLGLSGITSTGLQNLLMVCSRFDLSPDDVSRCLVSLKSTGFSKITVISILEAFPMVITMKEDDIKHKTRFLMNLGLEMRQIDSIITSFPLFFEFDVRTRMQPLISEFEELGFNLNQVKKKVVENPRVLELEVGELTHILNILKSLKCRVPIKDRIFSNGEFNAGYEAKLRVDCLRDYGFTHRDAFTLLWKEPRMIEYEVDDIKNKIEFLLHTMKLNVLCLLQVPQYLGLNFEKKIVPRFKVIDHLKSRGALSYDLSLRDIIKPSRMRFYNLYVKPYPECEEMYGKTSKLVEVRNKHPVGIWKLFRPDHYPESVDDVKNIKSFMKSLA